jgi:hypothetical protein
MNAAHVRSFLKALSSDEAVDWAAAESSAVAGTRQLLRDLKVHRADLGCAPEFAWA